MRKLLTLAATVALLALGSVNEAKAADGVGASAATIGGTTVATIVAAGMFAGTSLGIVYLVARDINQGGLTRKYAEVVPGSGFQSRDLATAAKLTHEFNVAMGYSDDANTTKYLASATK